MMSGYLRRSSASFSSLPCSRLSPTDDPISKSPTHNTAHTYIHQGLEKKA